MPARINVKIKVPGILQDKALLDDLERLLRGKTQRDLKQHFRGTVEGWEKPPTFQHEFARSNSRYGMGVRVFASGRNKDKYALVVKGSPPHLIRAKGKGMMIYQPGYVPSTLPGSLRSRRKRRWGQPVRARSIGHPGFEGRRFDKQIADLYEPIFADDVRRTVKKWTTTAWR